MSRAQISFLDEIIADNFAGGGGASTGIELATGRVVDIAVNHDPDAILMHQTNHPHTVHYQASVWDIDPEKVCGGRPVGLAWFSPDCKHFSKAKGGKPVDKKIRGLAWIALRWAGTVRPRVIIVENVEEFPTWWPVRRGKPVKSKRGQTFDRFVAQLRALGYTVEWRELVAADYGAPTTRKRFFLVARCDGRPVVWPEPTHAPRDSEAAKSGRLKPWRSAAEVIDWSLPCPSVFDTKEEVREKYGLTAVRPLADKTMRRVARGVDKFTIKSDEPFLLQVNHSGQGDRTVSVYKPMPTITAKLGIGVSKSYIVPWTVTNTTNSTGHPLDEPIDTARTGGGGGQMLMAANLVQYHSEQAERVRGQHLREPIMTIDAANRYGLVAASLTKYYGGGRHGQTADMPLHTITTKDREGLIAANLVKFYGGIVGASTTMPVPTITAIDHNALMMAHMTELYGTSNGRDIKAPVSTVTAEGQHQAVVVTDIVRVDASVDLGHWPEVRGLLNKYCGYELAEDEVLLLRIGAYWYYIRDIGLRMLTPRELYDANGFPPDYIIDRDYKGNEYQKAKQVARCGNAVPPPFATALVRANFPEWCDKEITTMAQFEREVAV